MKKIIAMLLVAVFAIGASSKVMAQEAEQMRVYAELLGTKTNVLGLNKNVKVTVDMGQFQSSYKAYTLQDEDGKDIKFNSMVAAMNYMGQRGWKFVQTYIIGDAKSGYVYHWLLYKDVNNAEEIMEGLKVKGMD